MKRKDRNRKWFSKKALIDFIDDIPDHQKEDAYDDYVYISEFPEEGNQEDLEIFLDSKEETIALLNQQIEQLTVENSALKVTEEANKEIFEDYKKNALESETTKQKHLLEDKYYLENQLTEAEQNRQKSEAALAEVKKTLAEKRNLWDEVHEQRCDHLERSIIELLSEQREKEGHFLTEKRLTEEENAFLNDQLTNFKAALDLSAKELNRMGRILFDQEVLIEKLDLAQVDGENLRQQLEAMTTISKQKEHEVLSLKKNRSGLLKRVERLESKIRQRDMKLKKATTVRKQYDQLMRDYKKLQHETKENLKRQEVLTNENSEKKRQIETQMIELEDRDCLIQQLNQQCLYLKEENDLWIDNRKDFEKAAKAKMEDVQMTLEETEKENQALTEKVATMDALAEEKEALSHALNNAHAEISKLAEQKSHIEGTDMEEQPEVIEKSAKMAVSFPEERDELLLAKKQINELMQKNEALKKEVKQSQQEIGEVLITAKKQANQTIVDAQIEAKHMINSAELELETISNRAKKIFIEATESKESVLSIYDELLFKIDQLSKGALLKERLKEIEKEKEDVF